ncbi:M15 family metallopeptidase [Fonticella tunisiensis]|uniref:D-alanyl-D-alanine carboxypeptidase n=1 Tax=Fonticella tunisiensis TaxID=1096341 RepID=A0A4R7KL21_9CLOT|nr:M15 family metallopeptidase [Fonticella tunisiensis]TDT57251.1 D-alanyl-D-alanine carboxypeptidase [Fonticella tunisiensis]
MHGTKFISMLLAISTILISCGGDNNFRVSNESKNLSAAQNAVASNNNSLHEKTRESAAKAPEALQGTVQSSKKNETVESNQSTTKASNGSANKSKLQNQQPSTKAKGSSSQKNTTSSNIQGAVLVTNLQSTMVLVNKRSYLPANWEPSDLVKVNVLYKGKRGNNRMRREAAEALNSLFAAAQKDGIILAAVSGFRSYEYQKSLFARHAAQLGETEARKISAYPGQSEHQTGLAMDVSCASLGYTLKESFGNTPEGKWLRSHAAEYGFIIRYPKGKESITGYSYEPWHIRYVGREAAEEIMSKNITLEEYIGMQNS